MITSISTTTLGGQLPAKFSAVRDAGFDGVELFAEDPDASGRTDTELQTLVDDAGLKLTNYFPLRDFEGMTGPRRRAAFDRAERFLDRASALGAEVAMVCSNTDPECLSEPDRIAEDFRELGDLAAARGLKVAFEALAWGTHLFDYRAAADVIGLADHPRVGLVLDSFHIFARRLSPDAIAGIPVGRMFLVQVSDSEMMDLGCLDWSRAHRVLPGDGEFPLDGFADAVKSTGYDGIVSVECFNEALRSAPPRRVAMKAYGALNVLWNQG